MAWIAIHTLHSKKRRIAILFVSLVIIVAIPYASFVSAAQLSPRQMQISNNAAGASNVQYNVSFTNATAGTLGSIEFLFCANSPLLDEVCIPPTGFDASNAQIVQQSGATGFSVSPLSGANDLILTRTPGVAGTVSLNYIFSQITNPSTTGAYYARILTYASDDASGPYTDGGGLALATQAGFPISAEVPPYLIFCTGISITGLDCTTAQGDSINLGQLNSASPSTAQSQMMAATNAENGYVISVSGTTMTSGNNILPPMQQAPSFPGTNQFGINLRANTSPDIGEDPQGPGTGSPRTAYDQVNRFTFNSGQQIAFANGVQDYRKYTVSYIVNRAQGQAPGVYATTLTYICLATF